MYSASLRPGIARGLYPERSEQAEGWLDQCVHQLTGTLTRFELLFKSRRQGFTKAVRSHGIALEGLSEEALSQRIQSLRNFINQYANIRS